MSEAEENLSFAFEQYLDVFPEGLDEDEVSHPRLDDALAAAGTAFNAALKGGEGK